MTVFHLFQKLDRTMRNRPDSHRWRVTMNDFQVEIFRRPVLTNEVTLGAIGIGNAPMPVPVCICKAVLLPEKSDHVEIFDAQNNSISITGTHAAMPLMMQLVEFHTVNDE